ncbi:hypothetical protein WJX77_008752 [Trebouxia sp. C0004]
MLLFFGTCKYEIIRYRLYNLVAAQRQAADQVLTRAPARRYTRTVATVTSFSTRHAYSIDGSTNNIPASSLMRLGPTSACSLKSCRDSGMTSGTGTWAVFSSSLTATARHSRLSAQHACQNAAEVALSWDAKETHPWDHDRNSKNDEPGAKKRSVAHRTSHTKNEIFTAARCH